VILKLQVGRWRCRNEQCARKTFVERLSGTAIPFARRTSRVADLVRLFGHAAGGRVSERLLVRLALPASDTTILRQLKRHASAAHPPQPIRVVGIDDWSWRKGATYGTIIVDLERRTVVDVQPRRSVEETARWLQRHPEIEIVSRDRCGLYAQGTRQGAPKARQVADRFHLLQNLRDSIEQQMTNVSRFAGRSLLPSRPGECHHGTRQARREARKEMFDRVQNLHIAGKSIRDISEETGAGWLTVTKWVQSGCLQERHPMPLKPSSPSYFQEFLSRQWEAGNRLGRHLFHDIKHRGYTGSYSHLERLLAKWRRPTHGKETKPEFPSEETKAIDPATGWQISPIVAGFLCVKPRGMLTPPQAVKVAALKQASPSFVVMRQLAMRFRGILRGNDADKLSQWLDDAQRSGIASMQRFARTLRQDLDAVRNAVTETWSNGQAEGQINRLKTLKRAMYGRASVELLRARLLPLQ
jgi:transposase